MLNHTRTAPQVYRTVWLSDIHLGFRGCSAASLLAFLRSVECEFLYLVGDIIDIWSVRKRPFWPQDHNNVLRTILGKAKYGTKVIYVPGNHDEMLRDYNGMAFGNIQIIDRIVHRKADGKRFLVIHGDQFDSVVRSSRAIALLGSHAYDLLLGVNTRLNLVRRKLGLPYWSLAGVIKHKVKNAMRYISNFEAAVAFEAARLGVDGVICGHIHRPQILPLNDITYCNCGDWVESNSALVEHGDGSLELLQWRDTRRIAYGDQEPAYEPIPLPSDNGNAHHQNGASSDGRPGSPGEQPSGNDRRNIIDGIPVRQGVSKGQLRGAKGPSVIPANAGIQGRWRGATAAFPRSTPPGFPLSRE